MQSMYLDI